MARSSADSAMNGRISPALHPSCLKLPVPCFASPLTTPLSIRHNHRFAGGVMKALGLLLLTFTMNAYAQTAPPTVAEAQDFMNKAETQFAELVVKVNRATWVQETYITDDTEAIAADAIDQSTAIITDLVEQAKRFEGLTMPPDLARKFMLLKLSLTAPAPKDPALRKEMTAIGFSLDSEYVKGKYCRRT